MELARPPGDACRLVLIGGCSRTGKTWLADRLSLMVREHGFPSLQVGLDGWIVSLERRPAESSVLERYDCDAIVRAVAALLSGRTVYPPLYDPSTRRRIAERSSRPLYARPGTTIIAEGVVALALEGLRRVSNLRIFVDAADELRRRRALQFYREVKGLDEAGAEEVLRTRELEEVHFIKQDIRWADMIFVGGGR